MLLEDEVRILCSCITIIPMLATSVQEVSVQAGSAQLPPPHGLQEMVGVPAVGGGLLDQHTLLWWCRH